MTPETTSTRIHIVTLEKTPIELCRLLKFENLVQSGGEAKQVIADGRVRVNGEIETRKRKQLMSGDLVEFAGKKLRIKEQQT